MEMARDPAARKSGSAGTVLVADAAVEEERLLPTRPSRCRSSSSGCQSGWTLYLEHSDGPRRVVHRLEPGHQRWVTPRAKEEEDEYSEDDDDDDDSMLSDASSGPPPRLLDEDPLGRRDDLEQHLQFYLGRHHSYYSGSGVHRSASASGGFGTRSRSFFQGRQAIVVDEDDLNDTATSSSAVLIAPAKSTSCTR